MTDTARRIFPDDAVVADAEPYVGARTNRLDVVRGRATYAQQNSSDTAIDGRGEKLVDEYCAAAASMLDGEQRAVRQNGNAETDVVADSVQAQIPFEGRAPATDVGGGHWAIEGSTAPIRLS
jgi:hypothetical protein